MQKVVELNCCRNTASEHGLLRRIKEVWIW